MQRRTFLKTSSAAGLLTLITPTGLIQASPADPGADSLIDGFRQPPRTARAQTWWHWMNGNVTADGITRDLEAMKAIGLGGFQNFDAGTGIPKGPVVYLSSEWLALKQHAIREAQRLGLEFTMHNCPGWSSSGGPWITPEWAMQQLTWSETAVSGGALTVALPQPLTRLGYYRAVRVLAFPALPGEAPLTALLAEARTGDGAVAYARLTGEQPGGVVVRNADSGALTLTFREPYALRSLSLVSEPVADPSGTPAAGAMAFGGPGITLELAVSDDGQTYRSLARMPIGAATGPERTVFDGLTATTRYLRISSTSPRTVTQLRPSGTSRLVDWRKKTNTVFNGTPPPPDRGGEPAIDPSTLVDLTDQVDAAGVLRWTAPAGNWTILRLGYTPVGELNRSAPDTGIGLECDKYSADAIRFHFMNMMAQLLPTLGPLAKDGRVGLLIDSYEVGMQNWTARFPEEFSRRAGYDLLPYLPALTGRRVGSPDTTERFLWDLRRTQADLMADAYYGTFTTLCHQHGLTAYAEPYDRGPMEEMQIGARVDVNMGEFWHGLSTLFQNNRSMRRTTKLAASIAHTNGQRVVGAEAFTGEPESARWQEYPFAMKALCDSYFTQGLNRIIFHRYAHQPHPTARPGMTMGPWGIHFDRTTTWWSVGRGWLDYIARCQYLLQQGLFVADLAYFVGEDAGTYTRVSPDELTPAPPAGYDYDLINAETLLTRARVVDGRLTLPDGMQYRVLVLPPAGRMTLALVRRLTAFVAQGLAVVGAPPTQTPGLRPDAGGDGAFTKAVAALWDTSLPRHIRPAASLAAVLAQAGVGPDVQLSSRSGDAPITWIHRRVDQTDVYLLANQRRTTEELVCTFRTTNGQAERWDAVTGERVPVGVCERVGSTHLRLPVQLGPSGSAFIVIRPGQPARALVSVGRGSQTLLQTRPFVPTPRLLHPTVSGSFTISLWAKPELNCMLGTRNYMGQIANPWTDYYAIYPPDGQALYGIGHATAGLAIGRNGVAVWQHGGGAPVLVLAAARPLSGWTHVTLVYRAGIPSVYVDGRLAQTGTVSGATVHPGTGPAYLQEGASYYNGDLTPPRLHPTALSEAAIRQLAAEPRPAEPALPVVALAGQDRPALLFRANGRYTLRDTGGQTTTMTIAGLAPDRTLTGPWTVSFPPDLGAPAQISLPALLPLNQHPEPGVRYFSGTATYTLSVELTDAQRPAGKQLWLDLGRVEVIAEVAVNGQSLGILWTRPYRVDITRVVRSGTNQLEIQVTNLWPNRLIGDEQLPPEARYTPGGGAGGFASLSNGAIEALPDWYRAGQPKPAGGRVTFTTWQHYTAESPLLDSGLIGPVQLQLAEVRPI